ncbi:hypothetical protein BC826DRAFT_1042504 [Russula brevipes]|nr:hypothetical protein BC826DRAFT_1042504 [Russula brevipes]
MEPSSAAPPTNSDAWKTLKDWREPIHRVVNSPDINIHIGIPQSKPPRSTRILPSTNNHASPRSPNSAKQIRSGDALSSAAHTQTLRAVKTGTQSNDEAPQSASLHQHLHRQATAPLASQGKPSPTPGRPPIPSMVPAPHNTSQSRGLPAGATPEKISRQPDRKGPTPNVTVTSPPSPGRGNTKSVGDARRKVETPSFKVQMATYAAPNLGAAPPPPKAQSTQPAQRQVWHVWIQKFMWK